MGYDLGKANELRVNKAISIFGGRWSWLSVAAVLGCSQVRCKEAGCTAGSLVVYEQPVSTPYDLVVRTGGLELAAHCPQEARSANRVGPNAATLVCDGKGFTVATANQANGAATPVGTNPVDASMITFEVELGRPDSRLIRRTATAVLTHTERPNGPHCLSVCYGRQGTLRWPP